MKRSLQILLALTAAAAASAPLAAMPGAGAWRIGPVINGRNYSVGMPAQPDPARGGGWSIDFPQPGEGHVHYVTTPSGPLAGASRIVVRYRIDAAPGTRFVAQERPDETATLSLYFQQRGDSWSGRRQFETYRWYSPNGNVGALTPGVHTLSVGLDEPWISVWGHTPDQLPGGWRAALENTATVGVTLGSASGRGHGVYATAPARLTVLSYEVI